ncbi:MAG: DUF3850 domain-containing protein [Microgenomates group bacterium]
MIVEKKVWPKYFEEILSGKKKFELRLADFEIKPGDWLLLKEWDPKTQKYTGRKIKKKVAYVLKTKNLPFWNKEVVKKFGYQIIQLE